MRTLILPAFALFLVANSESTDSFHTTVISASASGHSVIIRPSPDGVDAQNHRVRRGDEASCGDHHIQAQGQSSSPPLELKREPASPDKPYAIYAVHRVQDGCSVMVMMGNRDDIRPLPTPMEEPLEIIPAQVEQ